MKTIIFFKTSLLLCFLCTLIACTDDEKMIDAPTSDDAAFSYHFDSENPNAVIFSGEQTEDTWYSHWDFGDNTSDEGAEVQKLYYLKGEYDVRYKIFTEGGTAESVQKISIAEDILGSNLVENGTLDDDQSWTVLPISDGVELEFTNGTVVWTGGGWGQQGIYQAVTAEANTVYQINMDISGSGMADCWFEVYAGLEVPSPGVDYTDGGIRLGLNTWDGCGSEAFDAPLASISCSNGSGDGSFEFPNVETVYIVIRSGGVDLGTAGVTIDNITVRE